MAWIEPCPGAGCRQLDAGGQSYGWPLRRSSTAPVTEIRPDSEALQNLIRRDAAGWTAVMHAADKGGSQTLSELLATGASVHLSDRLGRTALHLADAHPWPGGPGAQIPNQPHPLPRGICTEQPIRARVTPAKRGRDGAHTATGDKEEDRTPAERCVTMNWAQRLKRVLGIDIDICPAMAARCESSPTPRIRRSSRRSPPIWQGKRLSSNPKAAAASGVPTV